MQNLYHIIKDQFPEFVGAEYPTFVEFIRTYYKWLADQTPGRLEDVLDISRTPAEFVQYFRNQLDAYGVTSQIAPYNFKYLTNIKEIYAARGSESGLVELLRLVSNADVTVDYPNDNVLRASDGQWVEETFITVRLLSGTPPEAIDKFIVQFNGTQKEAFPTLYEVINDTDVRITYLTTILPVAESRVVILQLDGDTVGFGTIVVAPSSLTIVEGGLDWQLGQVIVVPGTLKNTIARVSKISRLGAVERVEIIEYGFEHDVEELVTIYPSTNNPVSGTQVVLQFTQSAVVTKLGKWISESGELSNEAIRIQDSRYYQQFSYVINSELPPDNYANVAQFHHVAGTKAFYNLNLVATISVDIAGFTSFPFLEIQLGPDIVSVVEQFEFGIYRQSQASFTSTLVRYTFNKAPSDTALTDDDPDYTMSKVIRSQPTTSELVSRTVGKPLSSTPTTSEILLRTTDKYILTQVSSAELRAFTQTKVLPASTATFQHADVVTILSSGLYNAEDYFAETYNLNEILLTIGE